MGKSLGTTAIDYKLLNNILLLPTILYYTIRVPDSRHILGII